MDEVKTYVKVWLPGYPETYYVDTYEGAIETLRFMMEEDEESEGVCFAPIYMTTQEFESLPDFEGF